jgi:N-acyl homoserine lactone hydrolase
MSYRSRLRGALAITCLIAAVALSARGTAQTGSAARASASPSVKLYIFDCGILEGADITRFGLKVEEVATIRMSVACYLVVHPKGTLMWDVGAVSDTAWTPTGNAVLQTLTIPDLGERKVTVVKRLNTQLAEIGYQPGRITHLALSHYHWDHTANANQFTSATWLVRQVERDGMFPDAPSSGRLTFPASYSGLRTSKTVIIKSDEHDVFGDGTVVAKLAAGHTPGHQVLLVKLAQTGPVVLSGDLYHYPEERTLARLPIFEFNKDQTRAARSALDDYVKKIRAQLWIQHDFSANAKLKKSPAYYE